MVRMASADGIDVIVDDWLSEMNIAWNAITKKEEPSLGYEAGFLTQLEDSPDLIVQKGIRVITNDNEYPWLQSFLTISTLKGLFGNNWKKDGNKPESRVERCEFPNILAIHFRVMDFLDGGIKSLFAKPGGPDPYCISSASSDLIQIGSGNAMFFIQIH
ncbi:hypothetical protein B0J13DRAFT_627719 [Dactylonectria estremocensis]|uniref:Acyclic terpene utilisation N-terminal domain-containing protein n=1 Tax=Dactylonectria estremocensis TaxID=1079267 RepID=A0A9P9DZP2_9HYPO|nr:hypothetical protein B0J13DRAFT_627719 [Dactylonectria estremocensis]